MAGQKTISSTYKPPLPVVAPPEPDMLLSSGDTVPDMTDGWIVAGMHDGHKYYEKWNTPYMFCFYYAFLGRWAVSENLGGYGAIYWIGTANGPIGAYQPQGQAEGVLNIEVYPE